MAVKKPVAPVVFRLTVLCALFVVLCDVIIRLRVSPEVELGGLDRSEVGMRGFSADIQPFRAASPALAASATASLV